MWLCAQVYPGQPASGSYGMSGTVVQGYTVPVEQLSAGGPIPGQPVPRWDLYSPSFGILGCILSCITQHILYQQYYSQRLVLHMEYVRKTELYRWKTTTNMSDISLVKPKNKANREQILSCILRLNRSTAAWTERFRIETWSSSWGPMCCSYCHGWTSACTFKVHAMQTWTLSGLILRHTTPTTLSVMWWEEHVLLWVKSLSVCFSD